MATDNRFRACRRKNYVHSAYVDAAIGVNTLYGSDRAYWLLIREKVAQRVIERVLKVPPGRMRRKRHRDVHDACADDGTGDVQAGADQRADRLTSQRVTVALVFQTMLGNDEAIEYLRDAGVPVWTISRVLGSTRRRQLPGPVDACSATEP